MASLLHHRHIVKKTPSQPSVLKYSVLMFLMNAADLFRFVYVIFRETIVVLRYIWRKKDIVEKCSCTFPASPCTLPGLAHDLTGSHHTRSRDPRRPIAIDRGERARLSWPRTSPSLLIGGADVRVPAVSLCGGVEKRNYNNHGRRETQGEWRLKTRVIIYHHLRFILCEGLRETVRRTRCDI